MAGAARTMNLMMIESPKHFVSHFRPRVFAEITGNQANIQIIDGDGGQQTISHHILYVYMRKENPLLATALVHMCRPLSALSPRLSAIIIQSNVRQVRAHAAPHVVPHVCDFSVRISSDKHTACSTNGHICPRAHTGSEVSN